MVFLTNSNQSRNKTLSNSLYIGKTAPWPTSPALLLYSTVHGVHRRVTKRCRLSWLTNSALVIRVQMRREGGGGSCRVSANDYSCAHHVTWSPNKLWRSTSIFNLWCTSSSSTRCPAIPARCIVVCPFHCFFLAYPAH
jgi:hypothetical protein